MLKEEVDAEDIAEVVCKMDRNSGKQNARKRKSKTAAS
jgi:hypothetical protein